MYIKCGERYLLNTFLNIFNLLVLNTITSICLNLYCYGLYYNIEIYSMFYTCIIYTF